MSSLGLSGLASGVDTSGIVDKLMAVERRSVTAINTRQTGVTAHQSALKAVADKLEALRSAATSLADAAVWKTSQAVSSSDPAKVAVSAVSGAGIGGHTIDVDRLASSAQHGYAYAPSAAAGSIALGSTTIAVPAGAK